MKKYLTICFLLCMGFVSCRQVGYNMFATIKGTVVDAGTSQGIGNADVILSPSGKSAMTDNNGSFEFEDLDALQYTVTVQKQGYETNCKAITAFAGETAEITITLKKR